MSGYGGLEGHTPFQTTISSPLPQQIPKTREIYTFDKVCLYPFDPGERYVKIERMGSSKRLLLNVMLRRSQIILPCLGALVVLAYLFWGTFQAWTYPYDGFLITRYSGKVSQIDPSGPAYNRLEEGDLVVSIGEVPRTESLPDYREFGVGTLLPFLVQRDGRFVTEFFYVVNPPLQEVLKRLTPLLVAFVFWGVGVGVILFNPLERAVGQLFLLFQASALLLVSGQMSTVDLPFSTSLFCFLLWLIGPLAVHMHFFFPQAIRPRGGRPILAGLYGLAFLGGLPSVFWGPELVVSNLLGPFWVVAGRLFLAINLLLVVGILLYVYYFAATPGARGKVRLIASGCILSVLPVVALSILPDAFLQEPLLPYHYAFLLLSVVPLTYGYVIFRPRLIRVDRRVSRGATYVLVYLFFGSTFAFTLMSLHRYQLFSVAQIPLIGTLLALVLIAFYNSLARGVQKFVDTIFYGGWYEYHSATVQLTQGLEELKELHTLAKTVSQRLVETLRLQAACVILRDGEGVFSSLEVTPTAVRGVWPVEKLSALSGDDLSWFLELGVIDGVSLPGRLTGYQLSMDERRLLNAEGVDLWVPVSGHGKLQGLLVLGPRCGGDVFSSEDLDILNLVARQIGTVVENIHLVMQLKSYAAELERKVQERTLELHNAKERVEAVLASVGDGVIVTDLRGQILIVNTAFEGKSGYLTSELVGQNVSVLFNGQNDPALLQDIQSMIAGGEIWRGELTGQCKNGQTYDVQLTVSPVCNPSGAIMGYVGSQRDITRQKELDRLKDQFITNISHDLRTPITNISLYLDLLEDAQYDRRERLLGVLKEQSHLLRSMVEDVLTLYRLTSQEPKEDDFREVDLNPLVEQVVAAHRPVAETAGLRLIFEPCVDLLPVRGDPKKLARAFTNLISNAVRYTPEGEVRVGIYPWDDLVCLEVRDTGIGIEAQDLPHIFERFYRGRHVGESDSIGTGLGLAIVKDVIDLHGGSIDVESEPGKGSVFRLCLPMCGSGPCQT